MKPKPPKNPRLETPFALAIRANIKRKIRELKKNGVTAMGEANLRMVTTPRGADYHLPGSFSGVNAAYHYAEPP